VQPKVPLWLLFIAAQLVDIAWATLVLAGVEKVRIVPGFMAASPLDLYYMPYTHSLVAAVLWSLGLAIVCKGSCRSWAWATAAVVGAVVFSHWILDLVVHRPDLPLYDDAAKVGFGLWDFVVLSFAVEALVLGAGLWLYLQRTRPLTAAGRVGPVVFAGAMLAVQAAMLFAPPPPSITALATSALASYLVFAVIAGWIDGQRVPRDRRAT
jgi:hypothetical protein